MRRVLAAVAAVCVAASTLLLAAPLSASAATTPGVPPEALGTCSAPGDAGGWDVRDQTSEGTSGGNTDIPVRPMIVRLGEPCYLEPDHPQGPAWSDSLAIVMQDRTAPVPMIDEDDDGIDDAVEDPVVLCTNRRSDGATPQFADYDAIEVGCLGIRPAYLDDPDGAGPLGMFWAADGPSPRIVVIPVDEDTVEIDWAQNFGVGDAPRGFSGVVYCENLITGVKTQRAGAGWSGLSWTTTAPTHPVIVNCNAGERVYLVGASARTGGAEGSGDREFGVFWKAEGLTTPIGFNGSGYYGGTQAAGVQWGNVGDGTTATCATNYSGTTGVVTHNMPATMTVFGSPDVEADGFWGVTRAVAFPLDKTDCRFLLEIVVTICSFVGFNDGMNCIVHTWSSDRFREGAPYGGEPDPTVDLCIAFPDSPGCYDVLNPNTDELAIVCVIEAEGDFFTFFGQWVADVPDWVACMVFPVGWDRGGKIGAAWQHGATGEFEGAINAAIPNGITCGEVGQIPVFGEVVSLDTCSADFAPEWAKNVVGWVIVLGLVVLSIRRILWAVGA